MTSLDDRLRRVPRLVADLRKDARWFAERRKWGATATANLLDEAADILEALAAEGERAQAGADVAAEARDLLEVMIRSVWADVGATTADVLASNCVRVLADAGLLAAEVAGREGT